MLTIQQWLLRMSWELQRTVQQAVLQDLKPLIQDDLLYNFDHQGQTVGDPWPPLKPSTVEDRRRKGFPPGPPLLRTGRLRNLVSNPVLDYRQNQIHIEVQDDIAAYHQNGTNRMPARPPVALSEEQIDNLEQSLAEGIGKRLRRSAPRGVKITVRR